MAETRFCPVCGTEVDETAAFCPTCGQRLDAADTQAEDIPAAPAWPQFEPEPERAHEAAPEAQAAPEAESEPEAEPEVGSMPPTEPEPGSGPYTRPAGGTQPPAEEPHPEQTLTWDAPPTTPPAAPWTAAPPPGPSAPPPVTTDQPERTGGSLEQVELPFTWPVTMSGWLIGVGALAGALSLLFDFRTFVNPVALISFVLLLGVAATVFLSTHVPDFANRRLWVLVVVVAAFGVGLWRIGFGAGFAAAVFFLATLAAAAGAIMLELGRDRPMGGPAA